MLLNDTAGCKMAGNKNLRRADKAKNDEFYTQLTDIERELKHYKEHFRDKIVLCNCDDPYESNFFKYFALNFNHLGLRKLITTSYAGSPITYTQLSFEGVDEKPVYIGTERIPYKIEINEVTDLNNDGAVDLSDVEYLIKNNKNTLTLLKENGDFRSDECIKLLKEADIVCTNPPFSLFRDYVAQLIEHDKKFVIIGNQNAITYKEIFPYIKNGKMWIGNGFKGNVGFFESPYEDYAVSSQHKRGLIRISGVMWFTNLDITKRHEDLPLYKTFNETDYPKFDNYDAINVDKTRDIPCDYFGKMGVPITFLDKHNPDQFELIDGIGRYSILHNEETKKAGKYLSMVDGKAKYFRIIIQRKR